MLGFLAGDSRVRLFQFFTSILFGLSCDGLPGGLGALLDALPGKGEAVPPGGGLLLFAGLGVAVGGAVDGHIQDSRGC